MIPFCRMKPPVAAALVFMLTACPDARPPAPPDAGPSAFADAGPPPDPLEQLGADARRVDTAVAWRAYGDGLAKAKANDRAAEAYAACAFKAGDDFEASLYCQAAAATLHKMRGRGDAGAAARGVHGPGE